MWILESKGDFFQGRRMWLKPGKQYLFGRVKNNGVRFALAYKTVSRKHFVISVDGVEDGDVGNIRAQTKVTIIDQKSKTGTLVNGELLKDASRNLSQAENILRIGGCEEEIVVRWQPCVLTFNLLKKELKAGALKTKQERVKDLDIKAVSEYITGFTTHVVTNKRNTPKGLQALIDGKWIVAESYVGALEYATTPSDLSEEENLSPLEEDFDKAWPNPADHLPPPGKEASVRPVDAYEPVTDRTNVFHNFTFVFGDQTQFDNLLPPITAGHGKALLYQVVDGESTAEDIAAYMRNAAGSKSFGDIQKEFDRGGVILVRLKDDGEWAMNLVNQVALKLDQRVIDQGEFLDAILANNALTLRQPVPYESNSNGVGSSAKSTLSAPAAQRTQGGSLKTTNADSALGASNQSSLQSVSNRNASLRSNDTQAQRAVVDEQEWRPVMKPKFISKPKTGRVIDFDDDFDPDAVLPYEEDENEDVSVAAPSQSELGKSIVQSRSLLVTPDDDDFVDEIPSKKRSRPPTEVVDGNSDDEYDDLLPAAAAMKRRKLTEGRGVVPEKPTIKTNPQGRVVLPEPKSHGVKDIDVKEALKAKRDAEEAAIRAKEDNEGDVELDETGHLQVYAVRTEDIDLPVRKKAVDSGQDVHSDRWDPKWNGRKNFKAFRRARDGLNGATDGNRGKIHTRVIVPLVDAGMKTYGIGDKYWDKSHADKERDRAVKKRASQRVTQSQTQTSTSHGQSSRSRTTHIISDDEDNDEGDRTLEEDRDRADIQDPSPEVTRLQQEAAGIMDHEIDIDEPRRTRADDQSNTQAQTQSTPNETRGTKRPNFEANGRGTASEKRQKTLPVQTNYGGDSDEDSDDMKFKFGGGRRGRRRI